MRLRVEVVPYALPFREPYVTARGRLERREMALLRLRTEEGLTGLGEAVPLVAARRRRPGAGRRRAASCWAGSRRSTRPRSAAASPRSRRPPRCAALDGAARPAWATRGSAGGPRRRAAPGGALQRHPGRRRAGRGRRPTPRAGPRTASPPSSSSWAPATTSARCAAVREALGPQARIRVDANAAWDVDDARSGLSRELEQLEIELAEQPVATLEEPAEVAASTSIPIAGDESVENRADAERAADAGRLRPDRDEALQGRRARRPRSRSRRSCPPTSPARSTAP